MPLPGDLPLSVWSWDQQLKGTDPRMRIVRQVETDPLAAERIEIRRQWAMGFQLLNVQALAFARRRFARFWGPCDYALQAWRSSEKGIKHAHMEYPYKREANGRFPDKFPSPPPFDIEAVTTKHLLFVTNLFAAEETAQRAQIRNPWGMLLDAA